MLTTEDHARRKWCPFTRVQGTNRKTASDDDSPNIKAFSCIAGECMAWRTLSVVHAKAGYEETLRDNGYCGLVGRPEGY